MSALHTSVYAFKNTSTKKVELKCRHLYTYISAVSKAVRGKNNAHTVGWNVMRNHVGTMNHKNHITSIVMHIYPWSDPSISSINHNYFYTCKVRIINIRVTVTIYHPCATADSELFLMTPKDVNNYTVCPVHYCNAP